MKIISQDQKLICLLLLTSTASANSSKNSLVSFVEDTYGRLNYAVGHIGCASRFIIHQIFEGVNSKSQDGGRPRVTYACFCKFTLLLF